MKIKAGSVIAMRHTDKAKDSYTYSLKELLRTRPRPVFDYAYIDAEYEWHRDGFSFLLVDKLLRVGGV